VNRLSGEADKKRRRTIVGNMSGELSSLPPIKVLRGLRGIGKTTVLLQLMSASSEKRFYFSADWPQVKNQSLYEYTVQLIESGVKMLFIDEIHTIPDWERDIKAVVDQFPSARLLVSGSAPVVFRGDRREKVYEWGPMAFSEYLHIRYDVSVNAVGEEWRSADASASLISRFYPDIQGWFKEYMQIGGFPFSLEYSFEDSMQTIFTVIKQSLEKDAVSILKLSSQKVLAMEKLLYLLATAKPGELSVNSLSRNLAVSKPIIDEIIQALEQMKILRVLLPLASGARLVRGEPKVLFSHPNLRFAICRQLGVEPEIGSIREELALFGFELLGFSVHTIKGFKKNPDYIVKKGMETTVIEIGGPNKGGDQIQGIPNALVLREQQLMALLLASSIPGR